MINFGIEWVVDTDLDVKKHWSRKKENFDINCPFCGGEKKMNINVVKNAFRCNKCGEKGYSIKLHQLLKKLPSYKAASEDLFLHYKGLSKEEKISITAKKKEKKAWEIVPAVLLFRDLVYKEILEQLTLSEHHRQDLLKRGLTDEDIQRLGYKSYPVVGSKSILSSIDKQYGIFEKMKNPNLAISIPDAGNTRLIAQIPGLYEYGNKTSLVKRKDSIILPVRESGYISQYQLRYNNLPKNASQKEKDQYKKYGPLSSGEKDHGVSTSGIENIHMVGFDKKAPKVFLTEGVLKADVINSLIKQLTGKNQPVIALLGVNNQSQLKDKLSELKRRYQTETIYLAFDMDYQEKKEVKAALDQAIKTIESEKIKCVQVVWDQKEKGLDDFLLWKKNTSHEISWKKKNASTLEIC